MPQEHQPFVICFTTLALESPKLPWVVAVNKMNASQVADFFGKILKTLNIFRYTLQPRRNRPSLNCDEICPLCAGAQDSEKPVSHLK